MGSFIRTLLIGVGIGLLIAPQKGEVTRQLLMERFEQLRSSLPDSIQQNPSVDQLKRSAANSLNKTAGQLRQVAKNIQ